VKGQNGLFSDPRLFNINSKNADTNVKNIDADSSQPAVDRATNSAPVPFHIALERYRKNMKGICSETAMSRRVLADYGAIFVASDSVLPPPVCIFINEAEVLSFQNTAKFSS